MEEGRLLRDAGKGAETTSNNTRFILNNVYRKWVMAYKTQSGTNTKVHMNSNAGREETPQAKKE